MASRFLCAASIVIAFFSVTASARICKTLTLLSYSWSITPISTNFNKRFFPEHVTVVAEISHRSSFSFQFPYLPLLSFHGTNPEPPRVVRHDDIFPQSSIRDRVKDILSIVTALLLGAGCGSLAAALMYLFWSAFSCRQDSRVLQGVDQFCPKKHGYVTVPDNDHVSDSVINGKSAGVKA